MRDDIEQPVEYDHVLPDGTTIHVRPITPDDKERMLGMWSRTSEESRRSRFMGPFRLTMDNVSKFTDLDPDLEFAQVATMGRGEQERIVGVARYVRDPDNTEVAEFASLVEDAQQGRGIGTALVRNVAQAALEAGVQRLSGDILAENARMLNLVRDIGLAYESKRDDIIGGNVVRADFELEVTDHFLRVVADTEREAAQAALRRFLRPEKVAVVGASRDPKAIGGLVFDNLLEGDFTGVIYPVNRGAKYVQGVTAYPSLRDCPEVPELVVVCVPAQHVNAVVDEAGELGVRAVCVISAGFSEAGDSGQQRQQELLETARGHGLRIVGPNCMGVLNGADNTRMNGTFSRIFPEPGRLAFSSQSGALGLAVLEHASDLGLGISTFVSVGNKADISGNDLLLYWEDDPDTDVVLLYLESFGNPRKFSRIARRISRKKPIVAVKSGRTGAGVRAATSHTAAIAAGDIAVEALFKQTGVIRTETLEELFDVATLLSSQPLPRGRKVAIVSNAGGPGILAADALESHGAQVPPLSDETTQRLREFLPPEAGVSNPVDMIASASAENYERCLEVLGSAPEVDAVFVIFIPAGTTEIDEVARAVARAKPKLPEDVPVVSVIMSSRGMNTEVPDTRIPTFTFPEDAARALGEVMQYAGWRRSPIGEIVTPDGIDRDRAREIVAAALDRLDHDLEEAGDFGDLAGTPLARARKRTPADRSVWLTSEEAEGIMDAYGVPLARSRIVKSAEQGGEVQREIGGPVAVKVAAPIHKTDVGGIRLGLTSPDEVADAIDDLQKVLADAGMETHADEFLVQEMVSGVVEMVVGVTHDPSFGPIVMTGMGGTLVELLKDVSVRITPLTDLDVEEMLGSLRMRPLLSGYRGQAPADVDALKDLLYRINALVEDLHEVTELDLNPVFVREQGAGVAAVDVRMKVAKA